jgi:hypothetical protein
MVMNKILWGKLTQENVSFYPKYINFLIRTFPTKAENGTLPVRLIVKLLFLTAVETRGRIFSCV